MTTWFFSSLNLLRFEILKKVGILVAQHSLTYFSTSHHGMLTLGTGQAYPPATISLTTPADTVAFVLFPGVSSPAPGTHL
jgi:hypothetical protein